MKNLVDVYVIYSPRNDKDCYLFNVSEGRYFLDAVDSTPEGFWGGLGGLSIVVDDFYIILMTTDFSYLVKVINFLISSIGWIHRKEWNWTDKDDEFPEDIILRTTEGNPIRISNGDDDYFKLSYLPKGNIFSQKRGEFYFSEIRIAQKIWSNACKIALDEYFKTLNVIVSSDPENDTSKLMVKYYEDYLEFIN